MPNSEDGLREVIDIGFSELHRHLREIRVERRAALRAGAMYGAFVGALTSALITVVMRAWLG